MSLESVIMVFIISMTADYAVSHSVKTCHSTKEKHVILHQLANIDVTVLAARRNIIPAKTKVSLCDCACRTSATEPEHDIK